VTLTPLDLVVAGVTVIAGTWTLCSAWWLRTVRQLERELDFERKQRARLQLRRTSGVHAAVTKEEE